METDPINILLSLNKISLVAFVITFLFVGYQVYLLKKETYRKRGKLTVPDFNPSSKAGNLQVTTIPLAVKSKSFKRSSLIPIIIGLTFLVIFAAIFLIGLIKSKFNANQPNQNIIPTPAVNFVASKGIKIYNQKWRELSDEILSNLNGGSVIIVGVKSVTGTDIDQARIRVNKSQWDNDDITKLYNKENNVYYKEHTVSTGSALLKIEAELHSLSDGWLGE